MRLLRKQLAVLLAMGEGMTLKSHRYLDGEKVYRLHSLDGETAEGVAQMLVEDLRELGLIVGNMKFPAGTYLLTDKGKKAINADDNALMSAKGWS